MSGGIVEGVTHLVGRAGSGKTTTAQQLVEAAENSGVPAAYYRMAASHSWPDALREIGQAVTGRDIHFPALGTIFANIPAEKAVVALDDYRHHTKAAGPAELREQVAAYPKVTVATFSLPHPQLPNPVLLGPIDQSYWSDLGRWGELTGGRADAVTAMRDTLEETDDEAAIPAVFAQKMEETRAARLTGRQKVGTLGEQYLTAMASIGAPVRVKDVAKGVERSMTALGPCRAALLRSGVIYMPARGWVDFACPFHQEWLRFKLSGRRGQLDEGVDDDRA